MSQQRGEHGGIAVILIILFMLATGSYLFMSSEGLISSKSQIRAGSEGNRHAANAMARLKEALAGTAKCSLSRALSRFRRFDAKASPYRIDKRGKNISVPCLLSGDDGRDVSSFSLEIVETLNDQLTLLKQLKATLALTIRPIQGLPSRTVKLTRGFRVSIASLDYFNVVFTGAGFPLVSSGGPLVTITGMAYHAGKSAPKIEDIYAANGKPLVSFRHPFLVRSRFLRSDGDETDWTALRSIFPSGIETGVLDSPTLDQFLPGGGPSWNHSFDYYYLGRSEGYPLPDVRGAASAIDCDPRTAFSASRAAVSAVPSPQGLVKASQSCEDNGSSSAFVYMRSGSDLSVTLSPGDNVFCGAVAGRRLKVKLTSPGQYAIFGFFVLQGIDVAGPAGAELTVHNPMEALVADVAFPGSITQGSIAAQFESLASSTARNFFLPMASSTSLKPWGPPDYMAACGNGYYRYHSRYQPLQQLPGFASLVSGAAQPLYIVDSAL